MKAVFGMKENNCDIGSNIRSDFVPPATHHLRVAFEGLPNDYYFLLLPGATMLAFSAAVEPLRVANQVSGKELYRWFTVTDTGEPIRCSNRIKIHPDLTLDEVPSSAFVFVCSGVRVLNAISKTTINWLHRHGAHGGRLGSLCAGVFALAQAGLLRNQTFTLHWENQPGFREQFPFLKPSQRRYETDGGMLTCGGGNAATDMMLEVIERDHGKELALYVSDMCIHTRSNHKEALQKTPASAALGCRNKSLINALSLMQENLEDELRLADIASHVSISTRQLERLFKQHLGKSPMQFYSDLRVSRAHALLNETNMSVSEIAAATGFSGSILLSRKFRERFGISPHAFQRTWVDLGRSTEGSPRPVCKV